MGSSLNRHWTISASLVIPIILMGLLAVTLVIVTSNIFQKHTLDDLKIAITELTQLAATELLDENLTRTTELAFDINTPKLKQYFISRNIAAITSYLDSSFSRYFVTAGVVKLEKIYVYDIDFKLLAHSDGEFTRSDDTIICPDLKVSASQRTGAARLTMINELCLHDQRAYLAVITPIGGLKPIGYIQTVTDPTPFLERLEKKLGFPINLQSKDHESHDHFVEHANERQDVLIAETIIKTTHGETAYIIDTIRDMKTQLSGLRDIRNNVIIITILLTLTLSFIALIYMRLTTVKPIHNIMHHAHGVANKTISLDQQIEPGGTREIVDLSDSLNNMTQNIDQLYNDVSSSNKLLANEVIERKLIEIKLQEAHDILSEKVIELNNQTFNLKHANEQLQLENQQRNLAEKQLTTAKEAAENANIEKTQFLSRMSHELRTPLHSILGYAQLAVSRAKKAGQEQPEWANRIYNSGCYLLKLVDEILDLTSIESGEIQLHMETVELLELVEECIMTTLPDAQKRNINTINGLTKCCYSLVVQADRTRLKQVFLNLLSNGVKYNSESGNLTLECSQPTPKRIRISITDTGPGIDQEAQDQLFIPFNRLDADEKCISGTGVGLAVARQLTELMNGTIGFESEVGKGSTFWVEFDYEETAEADNTCTAMADANSNDKTNLKSNTTVLHIDDHPDNLHLITDIFEHHMSDIRLISIDNANQGIQLAFSEHPDLILLDINMPEIDGIEAFAMLQEKPETSDIPVIALSALAYSTDIQQALKAGFRAYITKPIIDIDEFKKKISGVINQV